MPSLQESRHLVQLIGQFLKDDLGGFLYFPPTSVFSVTCLFALHSRCRAADF